MKKLFPKISILALTLVITFAFGITAPQKALAADGCPEGQSLASKFNSEGQPISVCVENPNNLPQEQLQKQIDSSGKSLGSDTGFWGGLANALTFIPGAISIGILKIASLLTYLAGALLNLVVQYSVVDMKKHFDEADAVNNAWKVIRDVANMGFIFVLLYAAIEQILGIGKDNQRLIVKIVVIAILINFSLFFTKFIIDTSNVLAMTFYDAIAPGALTGTAPGLLGKTGVADSLMQPLGLQSIWNTTGLSGTKILTVGVMGTIVTLIAAFVFFAIALMFIIRFVVLIFVLVLSPIAFVAFALPGLEGKTNEWWSALSGQAFFAPIYFMLTWIVILVSRGLLKGGGSMADALGGTIGAAGQAQAPTSGELQILLNFIIMIALLIFSLMTAKDWANKAGSGVSKLTSWATGFAGDKTLGMAGGLGRNTIGRFADARANNQGLKDRAAAGSKMAQLQLAAARKTAGSSFDFRATTAGGATVGGLGAGKAGGKGGFTDFKKKKAEDEAKYAGSLAPGDEAISRAEQAVINAKPEEKAAAQARLIKLRGENDAEFTERQKQERERHDNIIDNDPTIVRAKQAEEAHKRRGEELKQEYEQEQVSIKSMEQAVEKRKAEIDPEKDPAIIKAEELEDKNKNIEADLITNNPEFTREREMEEEIQKMTDERDRTNIPELKTQRTFEIEKRKEELEIAKKANVVTRGLMKEEVALRKEELEKAKKIAKERREAIESEINDMNKVVEDLKAMAEQKKKEGDLEIVAIKQAVDINNGAAAERREALKNEKNESVSAMRKTQGAAERRKQDYANAVEKSTWAKFRGYNTAAAAQIRKGKKSVKDYVDEAMKASGEKTDEKSEDAPKEEAPKTT